MISLKPKLNLKQNSSSATSVANKEFIISKKDIELQHVKNQLKEDKEKLQATIGMEELIKDQGNEIDALK